MTAYLVANGDRCEDGVLLNALSSAELVIAVDGGINHLCDIGVRPDIIIGDMDSSSSENGALKGIDYIKLPTEKNLTDLEFAVDYAVDQGADYIVIYDAFGGRLDHFLTNIGLLHRVCEKRKNVLIEYKDGNQTIRALKSYNRIVGIKGKTFSIIPQSDIVSLSIKGAKYPLDKMNIGMGSSRCQSNIASEDELVITFERGLALITINELSYKR